MLHRMLAKWLTSANDNAILCYNITVGDVRKGNVNLAPNEWVHLINCVYVPRMKCCDISIAERVTTRAEYNQMLHEVGKMLDRQDSSVRVICSLIIACAIFGYIHEIYYRWICEN